MTLATSAAGTAVTFAATGDDLENGVIAAVCCTFLQGVMARAELGLHQLDLVPARAGDYGAKLDNCVTVLASSRVSTCSNNSTARSKSVR